MDKIVKRRENFAIMVEGAYKLRNGARIPMQWSDGKNLGFSAAAPEKLYLPVDTAIDAPTVAEQESDSLFMLNRTRRLIKLRHTEPALKAYAEFVPLYARDNTYPFIYARTADKDVVLVFLNPSVIGTEAEFTIPSGYSELKLLAGKEITISHGSNTMKVGMPGQSYAIYKVKKQ